MSKNSVFSELSLLHSYLSELSGPKLAETDNSPNKNLSLGTELQKMLLVMDREKGGIKWFTDNSTPD